MNTGFERNKSGLVVALANYMSKPSITLQAFEHISDQDYAVILSSNMKSDKFDFDAYNTAFCDLTKSNFSILSKSLLPIESNDKTLFRAIARHNVESKPYTEDSVKGFKAIRANMFLDEDDVTIWKLEGEGDNKRLVRMSKQDYSSILETKKSRSSILSSADTCHCYEMGDYAYFYNHEIKAMDFGYVLERDSKEYVFTRSKETLIPLQSAMQVIIAHENRNPAKNPIIRRQHMINAGEYSMEGYLDYLRKLYGSDSEYYKAVERSIREYMVD